ncbi:endogenous retrovirus group K member 19 Env polyprotein-like isoform X2 [Hylobates moloch]|uniref:endogenous retrovirus group K member 19 Env polyprotein-like isoform X2 n=1 Tax=Hylobates moloch TaxID=81572 RepID=UPI002677493F|nr:endogenous retrovirus group K member 19 Env polyprotein-like isoform X2 [Hylobates moloch]
MKRSQKQKAKTPWKPKSNFRRLTHKLHDLHIETKSRRVTYNTACSTPPTWGHIKVLSHQTENFLKEKGIPKTTGNIILAAFMVVSAAVSILPVGAIQNYTYWAYIPFLPLIRFVSRMDSPVEVYTNNSAFVPVPNDDWFPAQPEEEVCRGLQGVRNQVRSQRQAMMAGKGPLSSGHVTHVTLPIIGDDSHSLPCPFCFVSNK